MISRRRILSRSRDDINYGEGWYSNLDDSEVWNSKEKLFKDHIQEVLDKWENIDDEIWAKVIVMEKNRRVAKAYARASIITINGSETGFDGYRIGINGLSDGATDGKIEQVKKMIGQGIKLKVDDDGNILIKRLSRNAVHVKNWNNGLRDDNAVNNDIIKVNGKLDQNKAYKLFDMKKFQYNIEKELRNSYPDRKKLEMQCVSVFSFVKDMPDILDMPCYVLIVNIVAIDILKSRLPIAIDNRMIKFENLLHDKTNRSIGDEMHIKSSSGSSSSSGGSKSSSRNSPSSTSRSGRGGGGGGGGGGSVKLEVNEFRPRNDKHIPIELPLPDYDEEDTQENDAKMKIKAKHHLKSSHDDDDDDNNPAIDAKCLQKPSGYIGRMSPHQLPYQIYGNSVYSSLYNLNHHKTLRKSHSASQLSAYSTQSPLYSSDFSICEYIYPGF